MRGSTRKRGGTWTAYWDVQEYDAETGTTQRRQRSKGGFPRQKDAQAHLDAVKVELRDGIYSEPSTQPLAAFMRNEWLPAVRGTVKRGTYLAYESAVARFVTRRSIGAIPLCNLGPQHFNALYGEMERENLKTGTRRLCHAVLHRAMADAVKWGELKRNPVTGAAAPKASSPRPDTWSEKELRRFLSHVEGDRLAAMWRLAASTGMRRGELLGAAWQSLDLDRATLRVERQVVPDTGGTRFETPKRERSLRTIALDEDTVSALRHHRECQLLEQTVAAGAYHHEHDLVFANELGEPLSPGWITQRFSQLRKDARISVGTPHVLRHTHVSILLQHGVPLPVVAARIGDSPTVVLKTYAHCLPQSDTDAAKTFGALLADNPLTNGAAQTSKDAHLQAV